MKIKLRRPPDAQLKSKLKPKGQNGDSPIGSTVGISVDMKKKLERNRATEKLIESQITSLDNLYIYFVEKLDENLTNEQEIQKRKELEDNEIIQ